MPEHEDLIALAMNAVSQAMRSDTFNASIQSERHAIAEAVIKVVREWDADLLKAAAGLASERGKGRNEQF